MPIELRVEAQETSEDPLLGIDGPLGLPATCVRKYCSARAIRLIFGQPEGKRPPRRDTGSGSAT